MPSSTLHAADRDRRDDGPRTVSPRRGLPGGRAVVGAFLVAAAAVGTFAAYTQATAEPDTRYVVAARDLAVGDVIAAEDLALLAVDLPARLADRSVTEAEADELVGLVTLGPLRTDDLVPRSGVVRREAAAAEHVVSFPVASSRALLGAVRAGETVDVVATADGAEARYVVRAATVVRVEATGSGGSLVYVLAVPTSEDVLALARAAATADVYVTRPARGGG